MRVLDMLKIEQEIEGLRIDIENFDDAISNTYGVEREALQEVRMKCKRVYDDSLRFFNERKHLIYN